MILEAWVEHFKLSAAAAWPESLCALDQPSPPRSVFSLCLMIVFPDTSVT